jgi:hypothetical protein
MALPAFEMLVYSWSNLQTEIPELAHYIGVGISKIQEYVEKGRQSRIYALAMSPLWSYSLITTKNYAVINPVSKLTWINDHWTPSDAANAKEWMLEAVSRLASFIIISITESNSKMTSFATSLRHKRAEQSSLPSVRPLARSFSMPTLSGSDVASQSLAKGLQKMASLQTTARRKVILPTLPGGHRPATHLQSSLVTSPSQPDLVTIPPAAEPTAAEKAAIEAENLRLDRRAAEQEFNAYLAEPNEISISNGINLVRFWDVRWFFRLSDTGT